MHPRATEELSRGVLILHPVGHLSQVSDNEFFRVRGVRLRCHGSSVEAYISPQDECSCSSSVGQERVGC